MTPTILVVFGPTGDLMARKVVPSLFYLHGKGELPSLMRVVGFGRRSWGDEDLRNHVREILAERAPSANPADVEEFLGIFEYQRGEFDDLESYAATHKHLQAIQAEWGECVNKLFYLAVPPENYATIFRNLAGNGLTKSCDETSGWTRVLVEKPFGDDRKTARKLDALLVELFREEQIYRIDHYLAKEILQGMMDFRFTNNLFECEWSREAIECIEITLLESVGAEKRGAFYDSVGALRDVGQNHLLQMLALVTMDQPASAGPDDIREARAQLIESLDPMTAQQGASNTFRAQSEGYRDIPGVAENSQTETYFKLRTRMSGQRWAGVPVTMQSGKRMGEARKEIVVTMRQPDPCILCDPDIDQRNRIVFTLEPGDRIEIDFFTKCPGFDGKLEERSFSFSLYERVEKAQYVEEYATLLHDAFLGDQTLFVSTREVDAGWRFIDPIIDCWESGLVPLETYPPDTSAITGQAEAAVTSGWSRGSVGVAGLGKMGAGLARNLMDGGWRVSGWNRHTEVATAMSSEGLRAASTLRELVADLAPPRVIWLVVPSGAPVDELLFGPAPHAEGAPADAASADAASADAAGLSGLLAPGDIVIDGGNSFWRDAAPRAARLAEMGIRYLDCGMSGGPKGAREGACLMIGGDREVYEHLEPMFADISLPGGYRFFHGHGAGHFVKMVHNGIEYGMMQAIAEGFELMHEAPLDLDLTDVADVYQHGSVVESRLVGWLLESYRSLDGELEGVSCVVGHTGEGAWTVQTAEELGVKTPIIAASLDFRECSENIPSYTGRALTAMRNAFGGHGLGPGGGPRR